ncbi:hypothetical protein VTL71DRAFT_4197 [Oculimacula yallundae]|uniref:Uncharacterized protein n=1 Tax=Oculimacula yallundae TaxID=86028 RepID=A0ABR4C6C0_9HELO
MERLVQHGRLLAYSGKLEWVLHIWGSENEARLIPEQAMKSNTNLPIIIEPCMLEILCFFSINSTLA